MDGDGVTPMTGAADEGVLLRSWDGIVGVYVLDCSRNYGAKVGGEVEVGALIDDVPEDVVMVILRVP